VVDFWVTVWHFPWDKSVIEIFPWQVVGLYMGKSSGRAAT
jgi:hypothetical protein